MTVAPQVGSGSGIGELPRKGYGKIEVKTMAKTLTKEQKATFEKYAKENGLTFEQAVNYACSVLENELEN